MSIHDSDNDLFPQTMRAAAILAQMKGDSLGLFEHERNIERACVCTIYPETYTCDLYTERGRMLTNVAWPGNTMREISVPQVGEPMLAMYGAGPPVIMNGPPMAAVNAMPRDSLTNDPIVTAAVDGQATRPGQANFALSGPKDLVPGDWLRRSSSGNYIGVLSEGLNIMRSGEFAQVVTMHDPDEGVDQVDIIGKTVRLFTGGGELRFETVENKTSMVFQIGADVVTESDPLEGKSRVYAALGQAGNLVDFRVRDAKGKAAYALNIFPAGDVDIAYRSAVHRVEQRFALSAASTVLSSVDGTRIQAGGDLVLRSSGSLDSRSFGRASIRAIGGSATLRSTLGVNLASGDTMAFNASALLPIPFLSRALDITATNGSVVFDIGAPPRDFQTAISSFKVNVLSALGSTRFTHIGGGFVVDTLTPLSVKLGGPPLAPDPLSPGWPGIPPIQDFAVLFTPLMALLTKMALQFDTHVHPTTSGPTGPPFIFFSQSPVVLADTILIPSKYVMFGG